MGPNNDPWRTPDGKNYENDGSFSTLAQENWKTRQDNQKFGQENRKFGILGQGSITRPT